MPQIVFLGMERGAERGREGGRKAEPGILNEGKISKSASSSLEISAASICSEVCYELI